MLWGLAKVSLESKRDALHLADFHLDRSSDTQSDAFEFRPIVFTECLEIIDY